MVFISCQVSSSPLRSDRVGVAGGVARFIYALRDGVLPPPVKSRQNVQTGNMSVTAVVCMH